MSPPNFEARPTPARTTSTTSSCASPTGRCPTTRRSRSRSRTRTRPRSSPRTAAGPRPPSASPRTRTGVTTVTATDRTPAPRSSTPSRRGWASARTTPLHDQRHDGRAAFIAPPDFENPTDADANNVYRVTVVAFDGFFADLQHIDVTVTNVNDNPPVITSNGGGATAAIGAAENVTAVTTVTAADLDAGATLTYSIVGGRGRRPLHDQRRDGSARFRQRAGFRGADRRGREQCLRRDRAGVGRRLCRRPDHRRDRQRRVLRVLGHGGRGRQRLLRLRENVMYLALAATTWSPVLPSPTRWTEARATTRSSAGPATTRSWAATTRTS